MDSRTPFGKWLRLRRKLLDLTQQELARQVGCSGITIRKIESGERKPSQVLAINLARVLQVPQREHDAFIRFARLDADSHSFSIPAWKPEHPSWRANQLPQKHPEISAKHNFWILQYEVIAFEKPLYTDAGDGRYLFEAWGEGQVSGDFDGTIQLQYTQVIHPKPEGINISQALPMRVAVAFTIEQQDQQIRGICTGMLYTSVDESGNGSARFQAAGNVTSVTIKQIDFFLSRVFIEEEVKMVEGTGTGAHGVIRLEAIP